MFEARLSASYGKKQVLRDISFCLPEGVTALLGRNGSGKSTLLHCIAGALPFEGSVKLDGKELKGLTAREKAKLLSILPQMLPSPDLPAEEVVGFGRSPYSARLSAKEREEVHAAMQKLGIGELAKRRVSTLSGGEKQKVFLAMLLVQDTPLVLLDEPTTYMDLPFKSVFFSVLQELKAKKKTVLFVSHDLSDGIFASDHVLVLEEGGIRFAGSREECLRGCVLERAFGAARYEVEGNILFR